MHVARIEAEPIVEEAVAGGIVVDAEHVRSSLAGGQFVEVTRRHAMRLKVAAPGMTAAHHAAEQVHAEPAPVVLVLGLPGQGRGGEDAADILGTDEVCARLLGSDGAHRQQASPALVDDRPQERALVAQMRVPMAVQAGETRRGQRLVDRYPALHAGVAAHHTAGMYGQALGE